MAAPRRIDLVLDSVKRLLRIGATANLLNLLQKQHPADLAQVFSELPDKDREAAFSILADRNGRLAMEALSEGGVAAGLPRALAVDLAVQTVAGAAEMAASTREHLALLREMVTSPGGTTVAGLLVLEGAAVRSALINAVRAAAARSKELSGQ